jgi:hypothetical protein
MEQLVSEVGTWQEASAVFDTPASDAPRPVLENERPRTCADCGLEYVPGKGASQARCASCWGKATSARRETQGRFGVARRS